MTKDKVNGGQLPRSSSNPLNMNGQSLSTESLRSMGGGETSVVATVMMGGMILSSSVTV